MTSSSRGNVPAYVGVYNSLYSDIMNNVFLENDYLPSESTLASHYGVSRSTLRQALAILNEDGLIIKSQGKGTLIAERSDNDFHTRVVNPLTSMAKQTITSKAMTYNYGPPTDIARAKLGLHPSEIVLACTMSYYVENTIVGYSFVQVPTSTFAKLDVNAARDTDIESLVSSTIFTRATRNHMEVKLIFANEIEQETLCIEAEKPLLLLESVLYDESHSPFARCKMYLLAEHYKLQFQICSPLSQPRLQQP